MKKKVLAFLLASTMVIEPFTVASAADFSDGMGHEDVQFNDDACLLYTSDAADDA